MAISFEVYRDGRRLEQFVVAGAMAIGPESVPEPGEVAFRAGRLSLDRTDPHAVGIALLWDAGPVGEYHLETTRLPHRDEPYNLAVELLRARLMKLLQKEEDWSLFEVAAADVFIDRSRAAMGQLAEALARLDRPPEASRVAEAALADAIRLSDDVTLFHAEALLNRRRSSGTVPRYALGCRVDSELNNQRCRDLLVEHFEHATVPMGWKQVQPQEEAFVTDALDVWTDALMRKRVPVVAGPLIDMNESGVPEWMFIWEHDFETLRDMAFEYVRKITQRYRRAVSAWNVAAGLNTNSAFALSFEQMVELTRLLCSQVKSAAPQAKTLVTVTDPWGEYRAKRPGGVPPLFYAEVIAQSGVGFDGFALELPCGVPQPGAWTRDLFEISSALDRFGTLGKPLFITAAGAPGRMSSDPSDRSEGALDPARAGRWRLPWSADAQAEWLDAVYRIALSKPFIESIAWGDLADMRPSLPAGGLFDDMLRPKPAFDRFLALREMAARAGRR